MGWLTEYKNSLKLREVEEVFDLLFYRPLAFILVKAVYRTPVTPNQLTLAAIFMGILAGCLFSVGTPAFFTAAALSYIVSNIFDCSDGQLSRLKHNGTAVGRIIDGMADLLAFSAVYIGIGIGFAGHQADSRFWLIMLILTGLSSIIHSVLVDFYRNRFLDYYNQRKYDFEASLVVYKNAYADAKRQKGKWLEQVIISMYLKYSIVQDALLARRKPSKTLDLNPRQYYRRNRVIMRFWLFIGPTTQITNLAVCSLFHRIDLFIWIALFGFNGLAVILWVIQQIIDRTKTTRT